MNKSYHKSIGIFELREMYKNLVEENTRLKAKIRQPEYYATLKSRDAFEGVLIGYAITMREVDKDLFKYKVMAEMILSAGLITGYKTFAFNERDIYMNAIKNDAEVRKLVRSVWSKYGVRNGYMKKHANGSDFIFELTEKGKARAKAIVFKLEQTGMIKL